MPFAVLRDTDTVSPSINHGIRYFNFLGLSPFLAEITALISQVVVVGQFSVYLEYSWNRHPERRIRKDHLHACAPTKQCLTRRNTVGAELLNSSACSPNSVMFSLHERHQSRHHRKYERISANSRDSRLKITLMTSRLLVLSALTSL